MRHRTSLDNHIVRFCTQFHRDINFYLDFRIEKHVIVLFLNGMCISRIDFIDWGFRQGVRDRLFAVNIDNFVCSMFWTLSTR